MLVTRADNLYRIFAHPNGNVEIKVVLPLQLGKFQTKETDWKEEKGSERIEVSSNENDIWSDARPFKNENLFVALQMAETVITLKSVKTS